MTEAGSSAGEGRLWAMLARSSNSLFVPFAILTSFSTYFCMYAFRKPFAAAKFEGATFFDTAIELKTAIVISQIIGYALSKYIGIKICSEVSARRRAGSLIGLILLAEIALVLYGLLPGNFKVVAIFLNGLPLGMVWGMVVLYLEGRRTSELLLAGLSCSFIVSSGIVKEVGLAMMSGEVAQWWQHVPVLGTAIGARLGEVSEGWMPAMVGLHFLPFFFLSVYLLDQLPKPSEADVAARAKRSPMGSADRWAFVRQFLSGLVLLSVAYFFLTAYRDFRDIYQVEILEAVGYDARGIITKTETIVAFGVMGALGLLVLIKDNRLGLIGAFTIMLIGVLLLGVGTALFDAGSINGFWWMTLTGLGSYLAYVPYGSVLFDRLMASTRAVGTAVFAIYIADAIGYTGSIGVQLFRDKFFGDTTRLEFFKGFTWFMAILGGLCLVSSCVYFLRKAARPSDLTDSLEMHIKE